jgi:hypothetical protein
LQNTQKTKTAYGHSEQEAWNADVRCSAIHGNVRLHIAARTRALLEHFNWELFGHPTYNTDLAPSNNHLFTYVEKLLGSQCLKNNEELMEGVKTWLSSRATDLFDTGIQELILDMTSASIPVATTLRSSLSMHVFFVIFFLIACFVNSSSEVTFRIALVFDNHVGSLCFYLCSK